MTDANGFSDDSDAVAPDPWGRIDLMNPGYGDDPYRGGATPGSGQGSGVSRLGQVMRTIVADPYGSRDGDPDADPLVRALRGPQTSPAPGLLGSADDIQAVSTADDSDGGEGGGGEVPAGPSSMPSANSLPTDPGDAMLEDTAATLSNRDRSYLDRYYDAAAKYAKQYNVNPAFPLSLGRESGFATAGTYVRTGDAFGMTNNNIHRMTMASSPEDNVRRLFQLYGPQMLGVGDDAEAFINAMQGRNAKGETVRGWRKYNSRDPDWEKKAGGGIGQMQRDLPLYLPIRASRAPKGG